MQYSQRHTTLDPTALASCPLCTLHKFVTECPKALKSPSYFCCIDRLPTAHHTLTVLSTHATPHTGCMQLVTTDADAQHLTKTCVTNAHNRPARTALDLNKNSSHYHPTSQLAQLKARRLCHLSDKRQTQHYYTGATLDAPLQSHQSA